MIRATIDGQSQQLARPGSRPRIVVHVETAAGLVASFVFNGAELSIVAGDGGGRLDRLLLTDDTGATVANLVNLDGDAVELAQDRWWRSSEMAWSWNGPDPVAWPDLPACQQWAELESIARTFGARLDGELPAGLGVFCTSCGWTGYDSETRPPAQSCPTCGATIPQAAEVDGE